MIRRSSISSNVATGGGVDRAGNGRGGGLTVFGTETRIIDSSFAANAAAGGVASSGTSGMAVGGGVFAEAGGTLTLTDSELTGNVASGPDTPGGTGGYAFGAASMRGRSRSRSTARTSRTIAPLAAPARPRRPTARRAAAVSI